MPFQAMLAIPSRSEESADANLLLVHMREQFSRSENDAEENRRSQAAKIDASAQCVESIPANG